MLRRPWPPTNGTASALAAAVAAVVLIAGCGEIDGEQATDVTTAPVAGPASSAPPAPGAPVDLSWGVVEIVRAVDDSHLEVTLDGVPDGSSAGCPALEVGAAEHVSLFEEPYVEIDGTVTVEDPQFTGEFPGCELVEHRATVALSQPLDGRDVIVRNPRYGRWIAEADGTFTRCELPACDPVTGEPPPADGCDHTLIEAVRAGDVPRHAATHTQACGSGWAVVDIDIGAGACGAQDGERCSGAGFNVDRTFWQFSGDGWELLGYGNGAGCGGFEHPGFPTSLCADLPPPEQG